MNCVYGDKIYTGKSVAEKAYLNFSNEGIAGLSAKPKGEMHGRFPVVTPAFIDPHCHVGMARSGEPAAEAEVNDQVDSILALNDALDSVHMDDPAFQSAVEMGVLYSCVVPGSANIVGGLSAVIRNYAGNTTEALVARAGMKAAFGFNPMSKKDWKGARPSTRMGAVAVLRKKLDEVRQKTEKLKKAGGKTKRKIALAAEDKTLSDLLAGRLVLRAHVHKVDDIAALLRLVDEFRLKVSVEHAMDVHQTEIFRELRRRNIAVTYGPMDAFAYKVELKHDDWRNAQHLLSSGVRFGLMTDHPVILQRQLLMQTRWFIRLGLTRQQAIEVVSRQNAQILGIDGFLGTLEKGKWASFACWNGDPFDLTCYPVAVYGEGRLLYSQ